MSASASEFPATLLAAYRPACGLCYLSSLTANPHTRQTHREGLRPSLQHLYYSPMKRPRIQQSAESDYDLELYGADGTLLLPSELSISHRLVAEWLDGG